MPMEASKRRRAPALKLSHSVPTNIRDLGEGYHDAFVTFIDILGFKKIVENADAAYIHNVLGAMRLFSTQAQRRRAPYDRPENLPIVFQFSDSIIRIQPVAFIGEEGSLLDFFLGEISSLLLLQGNLVCNGMLIRGGLTFGKICVQNGQVFGPAFVQAYKIESALALYPRIVVDENLCKYSSKNPLIEDIDRRTWQEACGQLFEYLERADDGQWAIHYLVHMYEAGHEPGISNEDVLVAHRATLTKLLSEALISNAVPEVAKIRWAASYHNRTIRAAFRRINDIYEDRGDSLLVDLDNPE